MFLVDQQLAMLAYLIHLSGIFAAPSRSLLWVCAQGPPSTHRAVGPGKHDRIGQQMIGRERSAHYPPLVGENAPPLPPGARKSDPGHGRPQGSRHAPGGSAARWRLWQEAAASLLTGPGNFLRQKRGMPIIRFSTVTTGSASQAEPSHQEKRAPLFPGERARDNVACSPVAR